MEPDHATSSGCRDRGSTVRRCGRVPRGSRIPRNGNSGGARNATHRHSYSLTLRVIARSRRRLRARKPLIYLGTTCDGTGRSSSGGPRGPARLSARSVHCGIPQTTVRRIVFPSRSQSPQKMLPFPAGRESIPCRCFLPRLVLHVPDCVIRIAQNCTDDPAAQSEDRKHGRPLGEHGSRRGSQERWGDSRGSGPSASGGGAGRR